MKEKTNQLIHQIDYPCQKQATRFLHLSVSSILLIRIEIIPQSHSEISLVPSLLFNIKFHLTNKNPSSIFQEKEKLSHFKFFQFTNAKRKSKVKCFSKLPTTRNNYHRYLQVSSHKLRLEDNESDKTPSDFIKLNTLIIQGPQKSSKLKSHTYRHKQDRYSSEN